MTVAPPRKRQRTTPRCLYRWLVVSAEYQTYGQTELEPPEYGCAVVYVDAWTRHEAIWLAAKTPEFDQVVDLNRGDNRVPVAGFKAERMHAVLP